MPALSDIEREARSLIGQHGIDEAEREACRKRLALAAQGEATAAEIWWYIEHAITALKAASAPLSAS